MRKRTPFGVVFASISRGSMKGGYDNEESVDAEEIEEVSIDLSSSSDEKSNNGGCEDVDNGDMPGRRLLMEFV